jgi:hypothetical protein
MCFSVSRNLSDFCFFCCLFPVLFYCVSVQGIILIFLYLLRFVLCPKISILQKVPWATEKMCVVLLLDEILYRYLAGPFSPFNSGLLCWIFLSIWSIYGWQQIELSQYNCFGLHLWFLSPVVYIWWSWVCQQWAHMSYFLLMYNSFISMKWPSLSLLTNLGLKPTSSHINIATPACFQGPFWKIFSHTSTLNQHLFLLVRWVSCKQQIIESAFLIQLVNLCLLMKELRPLTFSVSIERCVVIPAILLFWVCMCL